MNRFLQCRALLLAVALSGTVLLLAGRSAAQCTLNSTSPSVTMCSPANGTTATSPVSVVAGTTDTAHPVIAMKVYLDNVLVYSVQSSQLSTTLNLSAAKHNITVNAWDSSGAVFKGTSIVTASGTGTAPVSVSVAPQSGTLTSGQTLQFTPTVLNTSNTTVNWSVDGFVLGNTTVGTITTAGLYTAGTASGNHSVVANSAADSTKSGSAAVTVVSAPAVSVSLGPPSASIAPNATQQFNAAVQNTTNTGVTWAVDAIAGGNTTVGTITGTGNTVTYTAPATTGSHTVIATSVADTTKSGNATVTVASASSCTPGSAAPSVTICTPVAGASVTSPVNVQAVAASNNPVTKFLVYIDNVLTYQATNTTSINANLSLSTGKHKLVAQFYTGAWTLQSQTITVVTNPVVSVGLSPTSASIVPNATQQFTATVQNTSNTAVGWAVNGVAGGNSGVGTITGTGSTITYTAPAIAGPYTITATSAADATKSASAVVSVASAAPAFPSSNHVFLLIEENQGFSQVFPSGSATNCASSGMPYLCGLAAANGLATNYYANQHGSLLAYLYDTSGSAWTSSPSNCMENSCASVGAIDGDNIVRALTNSGKTWRGYFENMPSQGYIGGDAGNYVQRHNPFSWYSDVANSVAQQDNMYPFTQFAVDVAADSFSNFSFIAPNLLDDAHGTGTQGPVSLLLAADNWLRTNIGSLLSTQPFQPGGDGVLIIAFDESEQTGVSGDSATDNACSPTQSSGCGGHIALVMIGPNVKPGSTTSNTYQSQNLLHTMIHLLGMSDYMNNANGAADIALLPGVP